MGVVEVTDSTFEQEVLRSELPVLVELHADWCQPCKQLAPIVDEVARDFEGKLKVAKIDVDRNPMVAQSVGAQSIPLLLLVHQGQVAGHQQGLVDKQTLVKMVEPVLPSDNSEVKPAELAQLLEARRAVPVDVREESSYARHRIPGALHIPADKAQERANELKPSDGRVRVLYGRTSDDAKELVDKLRSQGIEVGFLSGGFLYWEADGYEVEGGGVLGSAGQ